MAAIVQFRTKCSHVDTYRCTRTHRVFSILCLVRLMWPFIANAQKKPDDLVSQGQLYFKKDSHFGSVAISSAHFVQCAAINCHFVQLSKALNPDPD